jgi:hypothetical protein
MSGPSKRCTNCKTEREGIFRGGYCYRCYRLVVQRRQVERWDEKDPSTLKGLPAIARTYLIEFAEIKAKKLKELEVRLWLLKTKEAQRTAKITGLQIEEALQRLAKWSGGKEDVAHGVASEVNYHHFNQEQRRVVLGWLFDIEESMRWNPRRYRHLLKLEC